MNGRIPERCDLSSRVPGRQLARRSANDVLVRLLAIAETASSKSSTCPRAAPMARSRANIGFCVDPECTSHRLSAPRNRSPSFVQRHDVARHRSRFSGRHFGVRRHVPRPAATKPPPDLAGDCGRGVPLATEMRRDINVRRTRLRLAVSVTDVALVLRQQGARIDRRRIPGGGTGRHRGDECGERSDCTEGHAPSRPSWARRSAERTAVSESCHEDPSGK